MSDELRNITDSSPAVLKDIVEAQLIKVYPYKMPNVIKGNPFIAQLAISIVHITQEGLNKYTELKKDKDGNFYFEMLLNIKLSTKLDIVNQNSYVGLTLVNEMNILGITNDFYWTNYNDVYAFTFNKPFNKDEYESSKQAVFIGADIKTTDQWSLKAEYIDNDKILFNETLTEMSFVNTKSLEKRNQFSRIFYTLSKEHINNVKNLKNENGISIELEAHTLINSIKAIGSTKLIKNNKVLISKEKTNIDLITNQLIVPFKMTPVNMDDFLTMNADWFDYDAVMPLFIANEFVSPKKLSEITFSGGIKLNKEDRELIEDMILISYMFSSEFQDVPLLTDDKNAGKLDPKFAIGHSWIQIGKLANKDPVKVIDGLYEKHIRKHPSFLTDKTRYQIVNGIINGLSRYISSTHTIGKGNNSYGWAYLPWFLQPFTSIETKIIKDTKTRPADNPADKVIMLSESLKFITKTVYFTNNFSKRKPHAPDKNIIIPKNIDLSSIKEIQTDRKLTLPGLKETVDILNKLPLPGDINTLSSQDLKYMFYLPIQSQEAFKKLMLNTTKTITTSTLGQVHTRHMPNSDIGKHYTYNDVIKWLAKNFPNESIEGVVNIKTEMASLVNDIKASTLFSCNYKKWAKMKESHGGFKELWTLDNNKIDELIIELKKKNLIKKSANVSDIKLTDKDMWMKINEIGSMGPPTISLHSSSGFIRIEYKYSTVEPFDTKTTTAGVSKNFSFESRETLFNKEQWKLFLKKFNIIPNNLIRYNLKTLENEQIEGLDKIIIKSVWGNKMTIFLGIEAFEVPMLNKDNEQISKLTIIFT